MIDFQKVRDRYYASLSPEARERVDAARREREIDEARPRAAVLAVRTDLATGREWFAQIKLVLRPSVSRPEETWIHLEGGPTGYESMPADRLGEAVEAGGWLACIGTPGRWDRLFVPSDSLEVAGKALGLR